MKNVFSLLLALCFSAASIAQTMTPTKGKEFWIGFMKNYEDQGDAQESLDIFVASNQNTTGTISIPGQGYSQSFTVNANVTTTLTLDNALAEIYSDQLIEEKGVLIETEDTVAVFAINFNDFTADATKVLPIQALGTEYMIASYHGLVGFSYNSEFVVVATDDGTEIEITPSANTSGGNLAGVPFTVQLQQGQAYQVRAADSSGDFTGTLIKGTVTSGDCRAFAVFSGVDCANIPAGCSYCDHIYEQNFPVESWGTEYYITPLGNATQYTYRILAYEDNTTVSVDGGSSITLNSGEWDEFNAVSGAHCLIADRAVSVIQYMEGASCAVVGDPAMLILNDASQKIDNITFATVTSTIITSHRLTVIIESGDIGNLTLDGIVVDPALFQDFPSCPSHVWANLNLTEGSHVLDAPGNGVTAYVSGTGDAESYAYSVGSFSPAPPIAIDEAYCTSDQVILEISQNYSNPYWYNYTQPDDTLSTGYQFVINPPIQNGIYVGVSSNNASGCEEESYFSVEVPLPPDVIVEQNATQICQYQSVQLNTIVYPSDAVYYYSWSPTAGLDNPYIANPIATPLETTTYTVTVTTPTECATNSASTTSIIVEDGTITLFDALPEESQFCLGEEVQLETLIQKEVFSENFDPGISWGLWDAIDNGTEDDVCGSVDGYALYFNGGSPRRASTIGLDVTLGGAIHFSLKIANETAPCDNAEPGDNIVLSYSTNGGGIWTPIQTFYESAYPDFLSVSAEIPAGAQTSNTMFRWEQVGAYAVGQDNWVIDNIYIGVNDPSGFDFEWSPSNGLSADDIGNPVASPTQSGWYYVETTDPLNSCVYTDSLFIDVGQSFELEMTPDTALCDIQGISIYANPSVNGNYDFTWSPNTNIVGLNSQNPNVTPQETTTYSVVVTSDQGCSETGEVEIAVSNLLDLFASVSDSSICSGEIVQLEAEVSGNANDIEFSWSPGNWISNPNAAITEAEPLENVTYTVTATHVESGCQLTEDVNITVLEFFSVMLDTQDTSLCITDGLELTASASTNAPLTWSWQPTNILTVNNLPVTQVNENTSAEIIVTATNASGCQASDTANVVLIVETTDLGPDTGFCEDEFINLSAGWPDNYSFLWSNGQLSPSISVNTPGTYWVQVTSPGGCTSEDEIDLTMFTYPIVDLGIDQSFCEGEVVLLDAGNSGLNFLWNTEETTQEVSVTSSNIYTVTVDNGYCFTTDDISIIFTPLPQNEIPEDIVFCFGIPPYFVSLDAGNAGSTFLWDDGSTNPLLDISSPGLHSVEVTTPFGCVDVFYTNISESCDGSIYIPNSFTPNGDGINDVFFVYGENIERFNIAIYNRWGELIFTSIDPSVPWLGERRDGDQYVQNDVYSYRVTYQLKDVDNKLSEEFIAKGHITVHR
jgi:gliding motility-associated-like protein